MAKKFCRFLSVFMVVVFAFGSFSAAAVEDKPNYVVLGDSIAFGAGLINAPQAVYGRIVADTLGFDYQNFAVPGHTTGNLMSRMKTARVRRAIEEADFISISIGGNNFLTDNLAMILYDGIVKNDLTRIEKILKGFVVDLDEIMTRIHAMNPNAVILLQTIYNPQTGFAGRVYGEGAAMLNSVIVDCAQKDDKVLLVDVGARLNDSENDFARDRIHPSAAGNEKIAEAVLETLYQNGFGAKTQPVINTKGIDMIGTDGLGYAILIYCTLLHEFAPILINLPL